MCSSDLFIRDGVAQTHRKRALREGRAGIAAYARPKAPVISYEGLIGWALSGFGVGIGLTEWMRDRSTSPDRMIFWDQRPMWRDATRAERVIGTPEYLQSVRQADAAHPFTDPRFKQRPDLAATELLLRTYLLSNGINQCDRLSMAASVECRLQIGRAHV